MKNHSKKIIFIVIDGLGDRPVKELDGKTPLENAYKPNINYLAEYSILGMLDNSMGMPEPTSDFAVLSLLGYNVDKIKVKRSILEVISENIPFNDGNLALHCNFATLSRDSKHIIDRRVGRTLTREEAKALESFINEEMTLPGAEFVFKHIIDYVGVLVIKDPHNFLSDEISDVDPWKKEQEKVLNECTPLTSSHSAKRSCELVNYFVKKSYELLKDHPINRFRERTGRLPANIIITRQASNTFPRGVIKFVDKFRLKAGGQARLPTERGIIKLIGMEEIPVSDINPSFNLGGYYAMRAIEIIKKLGKYDFIYAHFDEADDAAHDGDPIKKSYVIEVWDEYFLATLLDHIDLEKTIIVITADHATVSELRGHTNDPVPLLIYDGTKRRNRVNFGEKTVQESSDVKLIGPELMDYVLRLRDKGGS